jgi:hypothetical protein
MEQEKRDLASRELTEAEENEIIKMIPKIGEIFDRLKTSDERRELIISKFKPFFDAGMANVDEFMPVVEQCACAGDRDFFINRATELARMFMLMRRSDTKGIVERSADFERRGISNKIIGYLDYEDINEDKSVNIHISPLPDKKPGVRLRSEIVNEFKELARRLKDDLSVEKIEVNSWIVFKHPELIEKLGFTLMEKSEWKGEPSQRAEISIGEFRRIYGA